MKIKFTRISGNAKTGPIPVTTTEKASCPNVCPLKGSGCYAELGHIGMHWRNVDKADSESWDSVMQQIKALPKGQLWRHNQAGDLPGTGDGETIDGYKLQSLIDANRGKRGFTYTHYDPFIEGNAGAIARANAEGFTVNLSGNNLEHADKLVRLKVGPMVTIVPEGTPKVSYTPEGNTVVLCPATYQEGIQCSNCGVCAVASRKAIIGFPVHGVSKKKAHRVFMMQSQG